MDGTESLGIGLALRWGDNHEVILGDRSYDRAKEACDRVRSSLADLNMKADVDPDENYGAIEGSDVVVICSPYEAAIGSVEDLRAAFSKQIIISPLSPKASVDGETGYIRPREGSASLQLKNILPQDVDVVSCFQGMPISKLMDLRKRLTFDVPVFADSKSARSKVFKLIRDIRFLRPLVGGCLENSYLGEMMGPLRMNIGELNQMDGPGFKFPE